MTDYIGRAEAIELMSGSNIEDYLDSVPTSEPRRYARAAQRVIWSVPAADVAPVVHARWVREVDRQNHWHCSACKYVAGVAMRIGSNYCPNCGAIMDLPEIEGTGL